MQRLHDLNKTRRAQSVRKIPVDRQRHREILDLKGARQNPLQSYVEQILQHLIRIIQVLLQEESSRNYIDFMNKTQEMLEQNQKRVINTLFQKMIEMRSQLFQNESNKKQQPIQLKPNQYSKLKLERKMMTQNLISYQRSSAPRINGRLKSEQHNQPEESIEANSLQLNSINHKLSMLEEQNSKGLRELYRKLQLKIEENYRDIKALTEKNVAFRLCFQQRLEISLQSLWNVIGDTQSKLCFLESCVNRG